MLLILLLVGATFGYSQTAWVRINQAGYLPQTPKVAVFLSSEPIALKSFTVREAKTDKVVFKGKPAERNAQLWGMKSAYRLPFSSFDKVGAYYVEANGTRSLNFTIGNNVYKGAADYVLNYMRQQRCGYNPYLDTLCHQHDGFIVDQSRLPVSPTLIRNGAPERRWG